MGRAGHTLAPVKRRLLLQVGLLFGAVGATGALGWALRKDEGREAGALRKEHSGLARKLRKRLPTLNIPDETLLAFVEAHETHAGPFKGRKVSRKLAEKFLLSTDFFPDADESRPLKWVAYYDPYVSVCRNPFRSA